MTRSLLVSALAATALLAPSAAQAVPVPAPCKATRAVPSVPQSCLPASAPAKPATARPQSSSRPLAAS